MDWNHDGKKDLLTGESYDYAHVVIFLNSGSDDSPSFDKGRHLQVSGADFAFGYQSTPEVVDWNNDGKLDLLCGEMDGRVYLLINSGTDTNAVFTNAVFIQDGGGVLCVGAYARSSPVAVDWNHDHKKDLLVGNLNGTVYYYENRGTDAEPVFNGATLLSAGGGTLDVGYYSRIEAVDWDGDGLKDLLVGDSAGYVTCFRAIPVDSDGDQIPDWWEEDHFGGSTNALPNVDTDRDGLTNLEEYYAGTDPTNAASVLAAEGIAAVSNQWVVVRWSSATNKHYDVERSTNLTAGFQALSAGLPATPPENVYTGTLGAGPAGFYRIRLSP